MEDILEKQLKILWFNKNEIKVYLLILEYKKILPSTISYISKINRTTTYSILKKLKEKILISEDIAWKNKHIIALPIENLHNLIEKQKQELLRKESITQDLIKELWNKFDSKKIYIPKIQYIEENILEDFLYNNIWKWSDSILKYDKIWWWFQDNKFIHLYLKWIDYFWKNAPLELELKLFTNKSEIEKNISDNYKKRHVKFSQFFWQIDSTMWVVWDYIIEISLKNKPYYLIETYNPMLANNLRNMFKNIWVKEKNLD